MLMFHINVDTVAAETSRGLFSGRKQRASTLFELLTGIDTLTTLIRRLSTAIRVVSSLLERLNAVISGEKPAKIVGSKEANLIDDSVSCILN